MLNPHEDVSQLTLNDPQLAVPLLDFMLWITTTPNVSKTDDYDEILDFLYSKVSDFRNSRNRYIQSRLVA